MRAQENFPACASVQFDFELSNNYHVSTNNPNGVQWSNQQIRIPDDATVYFDRNVSMEKCTLRIGKNAKIIIEGAYGLTTTNDCIFAECTEMWEGIVIKANAHVQLDRTDFQNAKSALFFEKNFDTYNTRITLCDFNNNNVGIVIGQKPFSQDVLFTPQQFSGNIFKGGNLLSPMSGKISFAGILIYRSPTAIIGDYSGGVNTFRNSLYGIYAASSSVGVLGCTFSNMQVQSNIGGYGIFSNGNFMGVARSTFAGDAKGGILTQFTRSLVVFNNCQFLGEENYGIFSQSTFQPGYFWISGNFFTLNSTNDISAIYHERIPTGTTNNIYNWIYGNSVVVSSSPAKTHDMSLIDIYAPYGGSDPFVIEKNYVGVNNRSTPIHGIYVRDNSNNLNIVDNHVRYLIGSAPDGVIANLGIAVENVNGQGNKINANDIKSTFFPTATPEERTSYIKCGIHLANSPNFQVCSNTLDDTYRAFHLAGNLNFCDFAKNTIGRHYHGLHCIKWAGGATDLGQQNWHENVWSTSAGNYAGYAAKYDDASQAPFKFRVDGTKSGHMPPSINISNWFLDILTDESTSSCVNSTSPRPPQINEADEKVMAETYPVESAAGQWDLERELLLKLLTYPELMPTGSAVSTWYDSKVSSSAWKFANAAKAYRDAFVFPTSLQSELDSLYERYRLLWKEILELDSMQRAAPYTVDSAILQNQTTAYAALSQILNAVEDALSDCATFTHSTLQQAKALTDELPDAAIYEEGLKNIYAIAIKSAYGDSLTEADYNILRDIANQCPTEGGLSVRIAPYRLPHVEAVTYLREEIGEEACEVEERQQASLPGHIEILLRPNPANDILTVLCSEAISGIWEIYSLTGESVLEGSIPADSFSFSTPLDDIATGIYFLRLTNESRRTSIHKFVVIH